MTQSSMLHVRVENKLKVKAAKNLANVGLTLSDAVRIFLTRITKEGGLPIGLTVDQEKHDIWFHEKVKEALNGKQPTVSHKEVMDQAQKLINRKRRRG